MACLARLWVSTALGTPATLRTTDAWAKQGRERYGWRPDLGPLTEAWLAEVRPGTAPLAARVARGMLDVCFLHPFADGNARASMLLAYHTLLQAGVRLQLAAPLLVVPRTATDPRGPDLLVRLLVALARPAPPLPSL